MITIAGRQFRKINTAWALSQTILFLLNKIQLFSTVEYEKSNNLRVFLS